VDAASRSAKQIVVLALAGAAIAAAGAARPLAVRGRSGFAFCATAAGIVLLIATLFLWLYPRVLVSSTRGVASPTIFTTSSNHYSLVAMTIVALLFLPLVVLYQTWAFRVFRARLGGDVERPPSPLDRLAQTPLGRKPEAGG
jgi:cytochrome d ubiquinol oxidase subunit II